MPVVDRFIRKYVFFKDELAYKQFLDEAKSYKFSNFSKNDIKNLARKYGLPYGEAYSIISFYSLLNADKNAILACNSPACNNSILSENIIKTHCLGLCDKDYAFIKNEEQVYYDGENFKPIDKTIILNKNLDDCLILKKKERGYYINSLNNLLLLNKDELLNWVKNSGLSGRGGANFPTFKKLEIAKNIDSQIKYLVCNIDESEPFVFKDRALIEINPDVAVSGAILSAYIIGATDIVFYIRGEYIKQKNILKKTIDNFLSDISFLKKINIHIVSGAGAYVCGEETALIESFEGKRGRPRIKPPYPLESGIYNKPTVVNNIETLSYLFEVCNLKIVNLDKRLISVSGDVNKKGIVEIDSDNSINDILEKFCDGVVGKAKFAILGGASGFFIDKKDFGKRLKDFNTNFVGSIFIASEIRDKLEFLKYFVSFFADESCGQCIPCYRGYKKLLEKFNCQKNEINETEVKTLVESMCVSTRCGLGKAIKNAINSYFASCYD